MHDRLGVPGVMFGPAAEDSYALVGRIVLVATLLEDRTLMLLWALDDAPRAVHSGRSASEIRQEVATRTGDLSAVLGTDLVGDLDRVISEVADVSARRNALVHSLWPNPTEDLAQGWRSVRQRKGVEPRSDIAWTLTSLEALRNDLGDLVRLEDSLGSLANRVSADRAVAVRS